ncbi:MAG TPA: TspO/MBR family protein [Elusimicrobiota bacterium]|nr:TspO/MBR family protein [Elusimicrobiota bacterium]
MRTLLLFVAASYSAGVVGALFIRPNIGGWYFALRRPSWSPPRWVFRAVWTVLYAAAGLAAWLVWRSTAAGRGSALALFGLQWLLNALWPAVFFGLRRIDWALMESVALWIATLATLCAFWTVSVAAGAIMAPYLAWATVATALNYSCWSLNK